MDRRVLIKYVGSAYSCLVAAVTFFCIAALVWANLPRRYTEGYELTIWRVDSIAILSSLASVLVGCALCVACVYSNRDLPASLLRRTLVALLVFAFVLLLMPAIATA